MFQLTRFFCFIFIKDIRALSEAEYWGRAYCHCRCLVWIARLLSVGLPALNIDSWSESTLQQASLR